MSSTIATVVIACVSAGLGALGVLVVSRVRPRDFRRPGPRQTQPGGQQQALDLEFRAAELAARERTLQAAERFRNLMISKLSHDVRTPLNSMITLSQLLADGSNGPLSGDQQKYIEVIHRSSRHLLALINDVLDLSHIEVERLDLQITAVDVRPVMRGVGAAHDDRARSKGLPLHLSPPRAPLLVDADEDRLRQVLGSLLDYALAATANGYVELSADSDDRQVTIRVSDTGPGMSPDLHSADFDAFLVHDAARSPGPAMILAGRLVKLMGGTLTVDSAPGEGTTFFLTLPRSRADSAAGLRAPGESTATTAGGHVLLVEDDAVERQRVADLLLRAGYQVSLAPSGQEGLTQLQAGTFDAVVLDLVMPGMSGLDLLRSARTDDRLATTPFVVLSALYMTRSEREVLGPSVIGVVRKGEGNADELLAQVARARATRCASRDSDAGKDTGRGSTDSLDIH